MPDRSLVTSVNLTVSDEVTFFVTSITDGKASVVLRHGKLHRLSIFVGTAGSRFACTLRSQVTHRGTLLIRGGDIAGVRVDEVDLLDLRFAA